MIRKLEPSNVDGLINVSFITDDNDIILMKCDACGKFISKNYEKFYCPHCKIVFLDGISYEQLIESEKYTNYLKDYNII